MRARTTCTVRALVEGTGSAPKQLRPMQTSSVWSRVIGTLCLASNGVLYAQNGERANFTSFPGAPHGRITLNWVTKWHRWTLQGPATASGAKGQLKKRSPCTTPLHYTTAGKNSTVIMAESQLPCEDLPCHQASNVYSVRELASLPTTRLKIEF
jgi:hypothetical protein